MKKFFGVLAVALLFAANLASPVAAQEKQESASIGGGKNTYTGYLQGNCTGLRNQPVTVEINDGAVKGIWKNAAGSNSKFEGKMTGNSFRIDRPGVRGESALLIGTMEGETLKFSHEQTRCKYTSTLKKE